VRDHIVEEIRRLAQENGAVPGARTFGQQTGIREAAWRGVYWARWSEAITEAGLTPNGTSEERRIADDDLLMQLAFACRDLGHVPTVAELRLYRRQHPDFPDFKTIERRFNGFRGMAARIREWAAGRADFGDIASLVPPSAPTETHMSEPRFSRRTVLAAIEVFERMSHAEFSRLLRRLGSSYAKRIRGEEVSLTKRLNDLIDLFDQDPNARIDGRDLLSDALVETAVGRVFEPYDQLASHSALYRAVRADGYDLSEGTLRRSLPEDIGLPAVEDEVRHLLSKHDFETAAGHLDQALNAHVDGNWSAANGQIRNFLDAILDGIAENIDPAAAVLSSGQPRRAKLAAAGFLSRDLNEWSDDGRGFINGLMSRLHPQGAHPGLSDDEDSTFRLHTVLLTARLLLVRYDKLP
jgi:hypothetical protein